MVPTHGTLKGSHDTPGCWDTLVENHYSVSFWKYSTFLETLLWKYSLAQRRTIRLYSMVVRAVIGETLFRKQNYSLKQGVKNVFCFVLSILCQMENCNKSDFERDPPQNGSLINGKVIWYMGLSLLHGHQRNLPPLGLVMYSPGLLNIKVIVAFLPASLPPLVPDARRWLIGKLWMGEVTSLQPGVG